MSLTIANVTLEIDENSIPQGLLSPGIDATKGEHLIDLMENFGDEYDDLPTSGRKVVYRCRKASTIIAAGQICLDTGTALDLDFVVYRTPAGSDTPGSLMAIACTLTNADTDNTVKSASLTTSALNAGDVIEFERVESTGPAVGAHGHLCFLRLKTTE